MATRFHEEQQHCCKLVYEEFTNQVTAFSFFCGFLLNIFNNPGKHFLYYSILVINGPHRYRDRENRTNI